MAFFSTREHKNAPKIPNTLPKAAPMSRFRLTSRIRNSKATTASAQSWPSKTVRIVTSEPGGGSDLVARVIAQGLTQSLGQQVIVDNRPSSGGAISMQITAKAVPDGHTILLGSIASFSINPSLYKRLAFDPLKDLAPLTRVADSTNILVTHPSAAVKIVKELIAAAAENTALKGVLEFPDFYATSDCRDLLFHVQETRCTIPQIAAFLSENNLEFLGFVLADSVRAQFEAKYSRQKDPDLNCWQEYETQNPDTFRGMYEFWVQKRA